MICALLLRKACFFLVIAAFLGAGVEAGPRSPKVGSRLPSVLTEARMRNAPVGMAAPQGGWVIYVFSPRAAAAEGNHPRVEELARSLPRDWVLLSVATDAKAVPAFMERLRVTVPLLTQVPEKVLAAYGGRSAVRTYILDQDWKLLESLEGPFEGKVAKRLADRYRVTWKPSPDRATAAPVAGVGEERPRPMCKDAEQQEYSRGAKAKALGLEIRCGMGGMWAAGF